MKISHHEKVTAAVGRHPGKDRLCFFNVGRQRALSLKKPELQAFSPAKAGWHVRWKFGKLVME